MIPTCRQDVVALSLFGKLGAILAPVDRGFWHARCSTGDDHRRQSCHNYLSGLIRYRWRNCRGEVYNVVQRKDESGHSIQSQDEFCLNSPWTVRLMDLESSPASLDTTHSYTAVSSTVGAMTTREPDESNLVEKHHMRESVEEMK